jgi:hypothetical protein
LWLRRKFRNCLESVAGRLVEEHSERRSRTADGFPSGFLRSRIAARAVGVIEIVQDQILEIWRHRLFKHAPSEGMADRNQIRRRGAAAPPLRRRRAPRGSGFRSRRSGAAAQIFWTTSSISAEAENCRATRIATAGSPGPGATKKSSQDRERAGRCTSNTAAPAPPSCEPTPPGKAKTSSAHPGRRKHNARPEMGSPASSVDRDDG